MPWRPTRGAIRDLLENGGLWVETPNGDLPDATRQERLDRALREAASIGDADLVHQLLREGADPRSDPIVPPLVAAAQAGNIPVMEALVDAGADVRQASK